MGDIRHDGQHGQQQVERVVVAQPEVVRPRHRLFMLDLVGADPRAQGVGFGVAQALPGGAELPKQAGQVASSLRNQLPGQLVGHLPRTPALGQRLQNDPATKQVAGVPGRQKAAKELAEEVHGVFLDRVGTASPTRQAWPEFTLFSSKRNPVLKILLLNK